MMSLVRNLIALAVAALFIFALVAGAAFTEWRRAVKGDIRSEIELLEMYDRDAPGANMINAAARRSNAGAGVYLVRNLDGETIEGNVGGVAPIRRAQPDKIGAWRVRDDDGWKVAYGTWVSAEGVAEIFIGRSIDAHLSFLVSVALAFAGAVAVTGVVAHRFAARRADEERRAISAFRDMTERLARGDDGEPIETTNKDLRAILASFNDKVHEINAFVGMFQYLNDFVSHEVIGRVRRAAGVLDEPGDINAQKERMLIWLEGAIASYEGILKVARFETGGGGRKRAADLAAATRAVVGEYREDAENKDVSLSLEADAAFVDAEAEALRLIADNLVKNAVFYSPVGGAVRVLVERLPDGSAHLIVDDTGPGLAAFPDKFDFEYGPRTGRRGAVAERAHGFGVGLILVYRTVRALNARIAFVDRRGADGSVAGLRALVQFRPPHSRADEDGGGDAADHDMEHEQSAAALGRSR